MYGVQQLVCPAFAGQARLGWLIAWLPRGWYGINAAQKARSLFAWEVLQSVRLVLYCIVYSCNKQIGVQQNGGSERIARYYVARASNLLFSSGMGAPKGQEDSVRLAVGG